MKPYYSYFVVLLVCAFLHSCGTSKNARIGTYLTQSSCNQQNRFSYQVEDLPKNTTLKNADSLLKKYMSFESLKVANAIGVLENITNLLTVKMRYFEQPSLENRVILLELNSTITRKINLASLEISALSSELDCEEERTSQIAEFLQKKKDQAETRLTVASIAVGASGAILTAAIENSRSEKIAGLTTGIVEAIFGGMIVLNEPKIEFLHERNALKEVWEGHLISTIFPSSIWYYLNYYDVTNTASTSKRVELLQKWINFGQISTLKKNKKAKVLDLYFGVGGVYSAEQLTNRANMYDQLESYINLMKQDLNKLSLEIEAINLK